MPRVPEETLQQILASTDIVDLVGRYVRLRRAGVNWVGLCPFHQEKNPSFNVSPQRGTYHCFGCGAGGNAFRFVQEHDGLSFMDAVKRLADTAGIRLEEEVWDANAERATRVRQALLKLHRDLADWYHHLLMKDPMAEAARDYLKSRGISAQTAKNWKMGYAPAAAAPLWDWARPLKYTENLLVHGGILARRDEDSGRPGEAAYPRFRHRLMFPIRNDFGEVIAFSGRLLDPDAKAAKYLNSPETSIFSKSRTLFGLDKSKRAIIKASRAIVCEGQLDLISAYEHGFENVVAPLGTAFTEFHARMLKRHAEEVVLCFDSDAAGYKAAERAFNILAPVGILVKVAPLPAGEDPDSLIRKQGTEAFAATLTRSRDFFDHMIDYASSQAGFHETRMKTRFAGEMAGMIRLLDNPLARDEAIQKISARIGLPEADYRRQVSRTAKPVTQQSQDANKSVEAPLPPQHKTAQLLTRYSLGNPEVLRWLRSVPLDHLLKDLMGADLLSLVWKSESDLSDSLKLGSFLTELGRAEAAAISQLLSAPLPEGGIEEAKHALEALEFQWVQNRLQFAQTQLKQAGLSPEAIAELQQQVVSLRKDYLDRRTQLQKVSTSQGS